MGHVEWDCGEVFVGEETGAQVGRVWQGGERQGVFCCGGGYYARGQVMGCGAGGVDE